MINFAMRKPCVDFKDKYSKLSVTLSDKVDSYQMRSLLERLDYLGINASIRAKTNGESSLLMEIDSLDSFVVKRCKKVVETLFPGAAAAIESIGGIPYREYVYQVGA